MKNFERRILHDLLKSSDGLYAFTFHERYKVRPDTIFKFISKYEKKGILEYNENRLSLTEKGIDYVINNKLNIPFNSNKFSNIPKEYILEKIKINEPYLPNIEELSKEILNL